MKPTLAKPLPPALLRRAVMVKETPLATETPPEVGSWVRSMVCNCWPAVLLPLTLPVSN